MKLLSKNMKKTTFKGHVWELLWIKTSRVRSVASVLKKPIKKLDINFFADISV